MVQFRPAKLDLSAVCAGSQQERYAPRKEVGCPHRACETFGCKSIFEHTSAFYPILLSQAAFLQVLRRPHLLLVTLVLCNAAATEVCCPYVAVIPSRTGKLPLHTFITSLQLAQALPIFLDRLLNPLAAILLSITIVLIFGEQLSHRAQPSNIFILVSIHLYFAKKGEK